MNAGTQNPEARRQEQQRAAARPAGSAPSAEDLKQIRDNLAKLKADGGYWAHNKLRHRLVRAALASFTILAALVMAGAALWCLGLACALIRRLFLAGFELI